MNSRWLSCLILSFTLSIFSWGQVTPTPTPDFPFPSITIGLPGLPADATPLVMVKLPPGTFMMGDPNDTVNNVQHQVTLTNSFYIGKYEITEAQWDTIMKGQGRVWIFTKTVNNEPSLPGSWDLCNDYISRLNQLGKGYFRFPTEAEWEYACRAGTTTRFFWGEDVAESNQYGWMYDGSNDIIPHAAGTKLPNSWGIYDMNGNDSEWCLDLFCVSFSPSPVSNPLNLIPNAIGMHVLRGEDTLLVPQGSYFRTGDRFQVPSGTVRMVGFRLVMLPEAPQGTPTPTFTPTIIPPSPPPTYTFTPTNTPFLPFVPNDQPVFLPLFNNSFVQTWLDRLSYVQIDPDTSTISEIKKTNIYADLLDTVSSISEDGKNLFHNGMIASLLDIGVNLAQISGNYTTANFHCIQINNTGKCVFYRDELMKIFDFFSKHIILEFPSSTYMAASKNLKTIAYANIDKTMSIVDFDGNKFIFSLDSFTRYSHASHRRIKQSYSYFFTRKQNNLWWIYERPNLSMLFLG